MHNLQHAGGRVLQIIIEAEEIDTDRLDEAMTATTLGLLYPAGTNMVERYEDVMTIDLEDHLRQFLLVVETNMPQLVAEIPTKDAIGAGAAHDLLMASEILGIETDHRALAVVKRRMQSSRYPDEILGTSQMCRLSLWTSWTVDS